MPKFKTVLALWLIYVLQCRQSLQNVTDLQNAFQNNSLKCHLIHFGYRCEINNLENALNVYNFSNVCPGNWAFINLQKGFICKQHDVLNFEQQHALWKNPNRFKRSLKTNSKCFNVTCTFRSVCENGQCRCSEHYSGKLCEEQTNYCKSNPCLNNVNCIPRFGGFTCDCPFNYGGKYCQTSVKHNNFNMKNPDFLYEPIQYAGVDYNYVLHATDSGFHAEVEIDFGDGRTQKKYHPIRLKNAFAFFSDHFQPPFNVKSNALDAFLFKYSYTEPNIYMVHVKAWNGLLAVYNTQYEVQVLEVPKCNLKISLRNAAVSKEYPLKFYRENLINFMSMSWSNCRQIKLKYRWGLHKLHSPNDELTINNLYKTKLEFNKSYLEIPAFWLDYGKYRVKLSVTIAKPKIGPTKSIFTWFEVKKKQIIAHIEGGRKIWANSKATIYLDAGLSYDPNYPKNQQPKLIFTWTCEPKNHFCMGSNSLNETGPILLVPPNALEERTYKFQVAIQNERDHNKNFTKTTIQEIEATEEVQPFYTIRCLHNCISGWANPHRIIALRGICNSNSSEEMDYKNTWIVYPNPDTNQDRGMRLDNSEFSQNSNSLILYEQQLEPGRQFNFVFGGYYKNVTSAVRRQNTGFAEFRLRTFAEPKVGRCNVSPQEGYAMLTRFTITCHGFLSSGENEEERILHYEVVHFSNLLDRAGSGAFVGFDATDTIANVTLGPGMREQDFITTLQIAAVNSHSLFAFFECNVTVFPIIYYFKQSDQVSHAFQLLGSGSGCALHMLQSGGNFVELTQQIVSAAFALEEFIFYENNPSLNSESWINAVQENFMIYLNSIPVTDLRTIRHIATAVDKVVNLPSQSKKWQFTVALAVNILRKIIKQIEEKLNQYQEKILHNDMDDFGILLVSICSKILQFPTSDYKVFGKYITGTESILERRKLHQENNPFGISDKSLQAYDSTQALTILDQFMQCYLTYKVPNERTTMITGPQVALLMKKAAPEYFTLKSVSLDERVGIKLFFNVMAFYKNAFCKLKLIIMDVNPNWYHDGDSVKYQFPLVKVNLTNDVDDSSVDADLEVYFRPISLDTSVIYNGSLSQILFWQIEEKHVQMYRITTKNSGKLLIQFMPTEKNYKLQIAIKKDERPQIQDFWRSGITMPQKVPDEDGSKGLSVFIDDDLPPDSIYYLGILPHPNSLKEPIRNVEEPILPRAFHYEDKKNNEFYNEYDYLSEHIKASYANQTLPYSFMVHSVQCITWDEPNKSWISNCTVKPTSSSSQIICNCKQHNPVTVAYYNVLVQPQQLLEIKYKILYVDNALIVFLVIFTLILFIGLFKWAMMEDRSDRLKRTVSFLVDNYPQCDYCYLVIVHTGWKIEAGTTSNVTIELEGTQATSLPHILKDWTREVLSTGGQDWFVIKTIKPLGEIYCLHVWTDYSGSRPSWYCSKIIVQDVKEQQIWFFGVEKWFDPIHGDASMSYTIYQSSDEMIFSTRNHIKESLIREFESGMHGWFSIFYKHPYSNFTRKQRVATTYLNLTIIMLILIFLIKVPLADSPLDQMYPTATYQWESKYLFLALCAVVISFAFYNVFVWLFRCTQPSSQWTETRLDQTFSRFNIDSSESIICINTTTSSPESAIKVTDRSILDKKRVHFNDYFFEPEEHRTVRSKFLMQELLENAGRDKVVPLRRSTSKPETEDVQTSVTSLNSLEITSPNYGQEIIIQSYCFPPCFVYIIWILLFLIILSSLYVIILYGISFGWIISLHYLISVCLAILFSIFVIEPLKLAIWCFYLFMYNRREYAIEDRSDLVETLNPEFTVPPNLTNQITEKINALRQSNKYMPLSEGKILKLKRNRTVTFVMRIVIADCLLLLLCILLLTVMIFNIFDSLVFLHNQSVLRLISHSESSWKGSWINVQTQEDLVLYLNNTLINNLQYYSLKNTGILQATIDETNYLIGVIRLRQIRKKPKACRWRGIKPWSARCIRDFDKQNYTESWNARNYSPYNNNPTITVNAWLYKPSPMNFYRFIMSYNETQYPAGSYVAFLGRTKAESFMYLEYLRSHEWFDYLTTVVYIDFILYNPHIHFLTLTTLMAERTEQGMYYVHYNLNNIKVNSMESYGHLNLLIFLLALFVWLMLYIHKESRKYSLVTPKQVFSKRFSGVKKILIVFGIINTILYIYRTLTLDYHLTKISQGTTAKYIKFRSIAVLDYFFIVSLALMLFFILLEICRIFTHFYRVKIFSTIISKCSNLISSFLLLFIVLILSLTWMAFILFTSYNLKSYSSTFLTLIAASFNNFRLSQFGNNTGLIFFYYILFITLVYFVFRWLIACVILHAYDAVKRHARRNMDYPILSNYAIKYFDSIDNSPNNKPFKTVRCIQKLDLRIYIMGLLFVDNYKNITNRKDIKGTENFREMAMNTITLEVVDKWQKAKLNESHSIPIENYERKKKQAKALARTIIHIKKLNNKLEYLNASIDILIRKERYKKMESLNM